MKVIIWIGCVFVASFIKVLLFGSTNFGAIPTVIFWGAFFALARWLCKLWDKRKAEGEEHLTQFQQQQEQKTSNVHIDNVPSLRGVSAVQKEDVQSEEENSNSCIEHLSNNPEPEPVPDYLQL